MAFCGTRITCLIQCDVSMNANTFLFNKANRTSIVPDISIELLKSGQLRPSTLFLSSKTASLLNRRPLKANCSLKGVVNPESSGGSTCTDSTTNDEESWLSITKFKMSDFSICDHVSMGLAGRGIEVHYKFVIQILHSAQRDEVMFEAIVKDHQSPLYNSKVVLRQLISSQAQRRGRRALEVLRRLARRQLLYHSYAIQIHGYVSPSSKDDNDSFVLVHGYHGSYSLQHWLQLANWLPTLEATLALDEDCVRRVGDDRVGGPSVTRKLRMIRILMRDLLIGVNYLHSQGLAHTELRLENVHISPVDRHVKVGILGNASDFCDGNLGDNTLNINRRKLMIAFDMRCVGFMMAKMVLRELMDPSYFMKFKTFLIKGNDPSRLREFLLPMLSKNSPSGNLGLQVLDRNWGEGWNLLSLMLATKPCNRISCLDALRHPFLCGPKWRVGPSLDIIKWGLGSTAVRISEEYIYSHQQRSRLSHFIELMEMLNPYPELKNWNEFLPGKWRFLYSTGRHIGLTLRQSSPSILIRHAHLSFSRLSDDTFSITSNVDFTVISGTEWPHNKDGTAGKLQITCRSKTARGNQIYPSEESENMIVYRSPNSQNIRGKRFASRRLWKRAGLVKDFPEALPVANLLSGEIGITMHLDELPADADDTQKVLQEVRLQIPVEMFDISKFVCVTYADSRLLVLRSVSGSALLFTHTDA